MIHHVSVGSNDIQRAKAFYGPLMSLIGFRLMVLGFSVALRRLRYCVQCRNADKRVSRLFRQWRSHRLSSSRSGNGAPLLSNSAGARRDR